MKGKYAPVSCVEARELSTKAEYKEVALRDRLRLQLHLFLCNNCKRYNQKNHKLSSLLRKSKIKTCSEEEKRMYQEKMMQYESQHTKKDQDQ